MESNYKITVIIPALNEEKNISTSILDVIKAFQLLSLNGEIIVVNDGSRDQTALKVEKLMLDYPMIRMLTHEKTLGVGAAYWDGVKEARGEFVTWVSGDGESCALEILSYLPLMQYVDIVIPYVFNEKQRRSLPLRLRSRLFNWIVNLSFRLLITYTNGNVLYRRCILEDLILRSRGFFFQSELLIKCIKLKGYLFAEVPISGNVIDSTKVNYFPLKTFLEVMRDYTINLFRFYFFPEEKHLSQFSVTLKRLTKKSVSPIIRDEAVGSLPYRTKTQGG